MDIQIGGLGKHELLEALREAGVELNEAARTLFAHEHFTPFETPSIIRTTEVSVADLGLPQGGTMPDIATRAADRGLFPCPLELGPHLRLQYLDQPEGHVSHPETRHTAPPGSLTVVSTPIADDEDVPKGFYLRRIDGILWLRGYRASLDHVWGPGDRLVFAFR